MSYKKIFLILFVILISCLVIYSINKIDNYKQCIVKISSHNRYGTKEGYGIIYKKNRYAYIVTNYHIISNGRYINIEYRGKSQKAKVLNSDEYEDIAILRIKADKLLKVAPFNNNYKKEDTVWIYNHNYRRIIGTIIDKNIKEIVKLTDGNYLINVTKLNLRTSDGMSGSPLYNHNNQVIGMLTMKSISDKKISYSLDIEHVLMVAKKLEKGNIHRMDLKARVASCNNLKSLNKYNLGNKCDFGVVVVENNGSDKLKVGDVITKINDKKIENVVYLKYYLYNSDKVKLKVYRDNKYIDIRIN